MDFNMILSINTKNNTVLMTSIPRDYYLEVPGKNGLKDKLSFINAYGEDMNRKTLEKLFDTKIDYQVIFNTSSLVKITDYVGGIEFCSDKSYTTTHALIEDSYDDSKGVKFRVKKGCQHLNGIQTLTVARERLNLYGGDKARQENCQKIMLAIFKKLASSKTLVNYNETLNELSYLYETNISRSIVSSLISNYIDNPKDWTINYQIVDGTAGNDLVHSSDSLFRLEYTKKEFVFFFELLKYSFVCCTNYYDSDDLEKCNGIPSTLLLINHEDEVLLLLHDICSVIRKFTSYLATKFNHFIEEEIVRQEKIKIKERYNRNIKQRINDAKEMIQEWE